VFTGRPFTAREMYECSFINSVVPRERLEEEVQKYALACASNRPTDTVVMQKTFFEVFKQHQGEYMGSVITGWLESMLPMVKTDGEFGLGEQTFGKGLAASVKDNDSQYPPDWRLSYGARSKSPPSTSEEIEQLRAQLRALQDRLGELEKKVASS
jgi:enoyl-CoA hydratase/carnithine racemase